MDRANMDDSDRTVDEVPARLERIEKLLVDLSGEPTQQQLTRRGWSLFWYLVAAHAVFIWIAIVFVDLLDGLVLYGAVLGSCTTLAIWHGMSLRPAVARWQRTILAVVVVNMALVIFWEDVDFEDLMTAFGTYAVIFIGAAICSAKLFRHFARCGIESVDGPNLAPKGVTILNLLGLLTTIALFMGFCRVILRVFLSSGDDSEMSYLVSLMAYGAGCAFICSSLYAFAQRKSKLLRKLVAVPALFVALLLLNFTTVVFWYWLMDESDSPLQQFWSFAPYFLGTTLVQMLPLVLTAIALHAAGHRMVYTRNKAPLVDPTDGAFDSVE